ncbi:MAG: ABC transporter ATP-binding protein [Planctomycetota bacterium]|jgi:ATP-binding cassette subfamily B protein
MKQPRLRKSLPEVLRLLRYFAAHLQRERATIVASLLTLLLGVALRLAEPWPLKFVLDRVIPSEAPPGMHSLGFLDRMEPTVLISALRGFCDYLQKVGLARIGNRVLRAVREQVYMHVQSLSLAFHKRARAGDLIVRVTRDVSLLRDVSSTALLPLLGNILVLVGMMLVMLLLEWRLALMALVMLPVFWLTTVRIGRGIHQAARKQRKREGAMASTAAESIQAIEVIQALSLEDAFAESFAGKNRESQKQDLQAARLSAKMGRTVDLLIAIITAGVLYFGAHLVLEARMTAGDLLVFLTYLKRGFRPVKDLAKYSARLAKACAAGERVMELLDTQPEIRDREGAQEAPQFQGDIEFVDVGFAYDRDQTVLENVNLRIAVGEIVAVTGPSGSGKTTLASLLLRLFDPTSGQVRIDGVDLRDMTLTSVRRQISVVLQDSILFAASIRENIVAGHENASFEEVVAAAKLANAHDFIMRMPGGYESMVGERGGTLSRGQRQRIAIARAALQKTPILILDEPLTGLDEENADAVTDALIRLAKKRSTMLISHDERTLKQADRVVSIVAGGIEPAAIARDGSV